MTAISKNWVTIADTAVDPDSPIDAALMTGLRDDLVYLREWLGASYEAGAVQDHNHDGVNSALMEVGGNMLRNGSFESSTTSWTLTGYTGGTLAVGPTGAMHGANCLAITSTVLANGGGLSQSSEYLPVSPGRSYFASALFHASVAGISSQVEIVWYNAAKAQISLSTFLCANTPTVETLLGSGAVAPAGAAYAQVRAYGGVPAQGTAVGTVYVDGCVFNAVDLLLPPVLAGTRYFSPTNQASFALTTANTEKANALIQSSGIYRCYFALNGSDINSVNGGTVYGQIYKNGVAYGTLRGLAVPLSSTGVAAGWTEDLYFNVGDTLQVFAYANPMPGYYANLYSIQFGTSGTEKMLIPPALLALGAR